MYQSFFKLKKKPFELIPDPGFMYLSRSHRKALTYLDYGIRERAGFILLTGEVGAGKTTLIRDLLNKKYDKVVLAKVFNTRGSSEELLAMINDDFGLPAGARDKIALMRELNDFLLDQYAQGKQPILIIDEAQNLGADLLEEIRLLSNLECSGGKLLQIMLVGQPELRGTLAAPGLLQLRQRISINCHLKALDPEETAGYILHRMEVAGNPTAIEFSPESLLMIHNYSRGIPRLINIICDFIMLSAFAEEVRVIPLEMVRDVILDLDFENHYWGSGVKCGPASAVLDPAGYRGREGEGLAGLVQRLETVEREFSLRVPAALKELSETLAQLKEGVGERLGRCEQLVGELGNRVAALAANEERHELPLPEQVPPPVRRLFGGADSH